jgi:hypothetical protein
MIYDDECDEDLDSAFGLLGVGRRIGNKVSTK